MKFSPRIRLASLFVVVLVIAVGCIWFIPFRPRVSCTEFEATGVTAEDGSAEVLFVCTVRNDGWSSIRFIGYEGELVDTTLMQYKSWDEDGGAMSAPDWWVVQGVGSSADWCELPPGETATFKDTFEIEDWVGPIRLEFEFLDWRDRTGWVSSPVVRPGELRPPKINDRFDSGLDRDGQ